MASVTLGVPINYFAVSSALGILGKSGKVSDNDTSWRLDCIILGGVGMWVVVAFTIGAILPLLVDEDKKNGVALSILGYVACATCMFYYLSPLTVLMEIIKTKDAAGLYTPMIVMNLITSAMWGAYGFIFIGDVVVYGPNLFAVLLSGVQLGIKCCYPSIDASTLQRKLTVVEMVDDFVHGDEEAKEAFMEDPRPLRGRAGTLTQNIICGDGTVGVIAFNEEEVVARNHRSNTLTSVAELVLDTIDLVGPRRHPADVVEVHTSPDDPSQSRGVRSTRAVSFTPSFAMAPRHRMTVNTGSSGSSSPSNRSTRSASPSAAAAATSRSRRRSQSTEMLPQIAEEGAANATSDEAPMESYFYGGVAGGGGSGSSSDEASTSSRRRAPSAPLLPTGAPSSSGPGHNAGTALLHSISEAIQGRSRSTSRATSYNPVDEEVHEGV